MGIIFLCIIFVNKHSKKFKKGNSKKFKKEKMLITHLTRIIIGL